jgi:uncharacterized protein YqfA (UPF0365 family)
LNVGWVARISCSSKQLGILPLLAMRLRRKIMAKKIKLTLIAAVAALGIALPTVAFAQSAYTTGTEASDVAAGYPSPYGHGA